jgi:hypothetical protein
MIRNTRQIEESWQFEGKGSIKIGRRRLPVKLGQMSTLDRVVSRCLARRELLRHATAHASYLRGPKFECFVDLRRL